jgi:hypothetical protein
MIARAAAANGRRSLRLDCMCETRGYTITTSSKASSAYAWSSNPDRESGALSARLERSAR